RRRWSEGYASVGRHAHSLESAHIGLQGGRNRDGSILLLIVLHHSDQGAADRQTRTVQGVQELGLLLARALEPGLHAPGLEVAAVRAGADLAIGVLRRQPDL